MLLSIRIGEFIVIGNVELLNGPEGRPVDRDFHTGFSAGRGPVASPEGTLSLDTYSFLLLRVPGADLPDRLAACSVRNLRREY